MIKNNNSILYENWLDYFNGLILHKFFVSTTKYDFLSFKLINDQLYGIVTQDFIVITEPTYLANVKHFLGFNGLENIRYNDYVNDELDIIFEGLHNENVLSNNGLYFLSTQYSILKTL